MTEPVVGRDLGDETTMPLLKFNVTIGWDFPDYKGWLIKLGEREEGQITWKDGTGDPAETYNGYMVMLYVLYEGELQEEVRPFYGAVYETFDLALQALSDHLQESSN